MDDTLAKADKLLSLNLKVDREEMTKDPEPEEIADSQDFLVRRIVTALHANYMLKGQYLTLDQLAIKCPEFGEQRSEFSPVGLNEIFQKVGKVLDKRDLPPYKGYRKQKEGSGFDPEFIKACFVLADVNDLRPPRAKLKALGMTTLRWDNFLKLKKNYDYWNTIVNNLMDTTAYNDGRIALARNVAQGDLPSIKYFNALTGKFVEQRDFDPRVLGVLMSSILEIIMRHVDGNTARIIADEMDQAAIMSLSGIVSVNSIEKVG